MRGFIDAINKRYFNPELRSNAPAMAIITADAIKRVNVFSLLLVLTMRL